ncbi:blastula protease 10-like [Branchiostoma floridae]|uniref:Metalloendopeptidase n=1 Tax=Branchiostoma floridae TaxID=7739 RepID=A0A9J7M1B5_BRAFL|nr:blastula protease 10-like [Branchiostoma floridae]
MEHRDVNVNFVNISINQVGAAIHELGHTVGFFHEQSRPDRDSYVKVLWENVRKNQKHNFEKYDWDRVNDFNIPYDYISVMHYRSDEFATRVGRRKLRTVVTTDPFFQDLIGQRISLSFFDIKLANAMYGCSGENTLPSKHSRDL